MKLVEIVKRDKAELLKLQTALIDMLPNDIDIEIIVDGAPKISASSHGVQCNVTAVNINDPNIVALITSTLIEKLLSKRLPMLERKHNTDYYVTMYGTKRVYAAEEIGTQLTFMLNVRDIDQTYIPLFITARDAHDKLLATVQVLTCSALAPALKWLREDADLTGKRYHGVTAIKKTFK